MLASCMLEMLEHLQCGGIIRSRSGMVRAFNRTARTLLGASDGDDPTMPIRTTARLETLLRKASPRLEAGNGPTWATVHREVGRPLVITQLSVMLPRGRTILALVDLERAARPSAHGLQNLFGLTPAEVTLATGMAQGVAPADLAVELDVSRTTVRSHLASIFAKTQTRRQAELVALLARTALLP